MMAGFHVAWFCSSTPMLLTMGALLTIGAMGFVLKLNVEESGGTA
jgi:hypothetical protein